MSQQTERAELEKAIAVLEEQRAILGEAVVETALAPLREKLAKLTAAPQRKLATLLFADISGFTALSENLDPEEVTEMMNRVWSHLDVVIQQHGGHIDKHMGDAVMAIWGGEHAREDDPEQAIRAALKMQNELQTIRQEQRLSLDMRIGINTGSVLLGEVGTTNEYTAMGDTVNLASRLEHAAPLNGVLISHHTFNHVRGIFDLTSLDPIMVKGKAEPIQVYVVQRPRPRAFRMGTRGVQGVETRMIGRDAERKRLQETLRTVIDGKQLQMVMIVGEAGVGKSRLLYEFDQWIDIIPEVVRYFKGRATPDSQNLPYALLRNILAFRLDIKENDSSTIAKEKLVQGLVAELGEAGTEKAHFIGYLIGFDFSDSPYLKGILEDTAQIRNRALHYLAQYFRAIHQNAPADPIAILLEDIHWADEGSLDAVEYLTRECQTIPLLLIGLARPSLFERRSDWEQATHATRIDLQPLSQAESAQLVSDILKLVGAIPAELRELIVTSAEGNPFYVEELVKMLIDEGVIIAHEEQWRIEAEKLGTIHVPPTLAGVLQARLDSLPEYERTLIQEASVVGRVFWNGVLREFDDTAHEATIDESLLNLRNREIIFRHEKSIFAGYSEYIFKHALLHEVAYESVLLKLRRRYHGLVAQWLIEMTRERQNEYMGVIAEHFALAGDVPNAVAWYQKAGEQALSINVAPLAEDFLRKALALVGAEPSATRLSLLNKLAETLFHQVRYDEMRETLESALVLAHTFDDTLNKIDILYYLAVISKPQESLRFLEEAETIARTSRNRESLAKILTQKSSVFYKLGDLNASLAEAEQALNLGSTLENSLVKGDIYHEFGYIYGNMGKLKEASHYFAIALTIYEKNLSENGRLLTIVNLADTLSQYGDFMTALEQMLAILPIAQEGGYKRRELMLYLNLGLAYIEIHDFANAETYLAQFLAMVAQTGGKGFDHFVAAAYAGLAIAQSKQHRPNEALESVQQGWHYAQIADFTLITGMVWQAFTQVAQHTPVMVDEISYDARACFEKCIALFGDGADVYKARALRDWAVYELAQDNRERGTELWAEATALFDKAGAELEVERMKNLPPVD